MRLASEQYVCVNAVEVEVGFMLEKANLACALATRYSLLYLIKSSYAHRNYRVAARMFECDLAIPPIGVVILACFISRPAISFLITHNSHPCYADLPTRQSAVLVRVRPTLASAPQSNTHTGVVIKAQRSKRSAGPRCRSSIRSTKKKPTIPRTSHTSDSQLHCSKSNPILSHIQACSDRLRALSPPLEDTMSLFNCFGTERSHGLDTPFNVAFPKDFRVFLALSMQHETSYEK